MELELLILLKRLWNGMELGYDCLILYRDTD